MQSLKLLLVPRRPCIFMGVVVEDHQMLQPRSQNDVDISTWGSKLSQQEAETEAEWLRSSKVSS